MELRSASIIDADIEGHYAFIPLADQISTRLHHHDFYEIFLVAEGNINHHINGETEHLTQGALVFIRPDDTHCFSQRPDGECKLINLAFLIRTFNALVVFLEFPHDPLLSPGHPPSVQLDVNRANQLRHQLQRWGHATHGDKQLSRQRLRALLASIISHYFVEQNAHTARSMPTWLQELVQQMRRPEHFIEGRDALLRLANRTPEYVGRSFKAYLDTTPSQFINDLRLDHADELLLNTDLSPTDIAYEVGFNNVSYYYHLFKARWGCAPNQFRNLHRRSAVP